MGNTTQAGWFADPLGRHDHRWWSGADWTEHIADKGRAGVDPLGASAPEQHDDVGAPVSSVGSAPEPPTGPPSSPAAKRRQLMVGGAIVAAAAIVIGAIVLFARDSDDGVGSSSGPAGGPTTTTWCDFVTESDALSELSFDLAPDQLREDIGVAELIVQRLPEEAPDEIKADATRLAEVNQIFYDAIKAADYDMLDADFSAFDATVQADLDAALSRLDAYTERECGRSFSDAGESESEDASDFDPSAGTMREQLATELESVGLTNAEATCVADNVDFSDPAVQEGDFDAIFDGVTERCGMSAERLAELEAELLGGG